MKLRQSLLTAVHQLLNNQPPVAEIDKSLAAIEILSLIRKVDELHDRFEVWMAQQMAQESGGRTAQA